MKFHWLTLLVGVFFLFAYLVHAGPVNPIDPPIQFIPSADSILLDPNSSALYTVTAISTSQIDHAVNVSVSPELAPFLRLNNSTPVIRAGETYPFKFTATSPESGQPLVSGTVKFVMDNGLQVQAIPLTIGPTTQVQPLQIVVSASTDSLSLNKNEPLVFLVKVTTISDSHQPVSVNIGPMLQPYVSLLNPVDSIDPNSTYVFKFQAFATMPFETVFDQISFDVANGSSVQSVPLKLYFDSGEIYHRPETLDIPESLIQVNFSDNTQSSGDYFFQINRTRLFQDFTITNYGDLPVRLQEQNIFPVFHNVPINGVFVSDLNTRTWLSQDCEGLEDENGDCPDGTPIIVHNESFSYWRLLSNQFVDRTVNFDPYETKNFRIEYFTEPATSGKYDFCVRPTDTSYCLDPYWVLDRNVLFDPIETIYPTTHDFNYVFINKDGNITPNGQKDWNTETRNQMLSDSNLVFWLSFDDYNGTHFLDRTTNHIDFNNDGTGFTTLTYSGILSTKNAYPCDGTSLEYCGIETTKTQQLSNLPQAAISFWFIDIFASGVDSTQVIGTDNNFLRVDVENSFFNKISFNWGQNQQTVCNLPSRGSDINFHNVVISSGSPNHLYFDGVECPSYSNNYNFSTSGTINQFGINGVPNDLGEFAYDDVRFFNKSLSQADANKLFLEGASGNKVVFYYTFDDFIGSDLSNKSNEFSDATAGGTPQSSKGMFDTNAFSNETSSVGRNYLPTNSIDQCGTACTVMAWIKPSATGNANRTIFTRGATVGSNLQGLRFYYNGSSRKVFALVSDGTNVSTISSVNSIDINRWQHVAMTFDGVGSKLCVFLDFNKFCLFGTTVTNSFTSQTPSVGSGGQISNNWFLGQLDDLIFYTRVLDDNEIMNDFNGWRTAKYYSPIFDGNSVCSDCNFSQIKVDFDVNRAMSDVTLYTRACSDSTCSTNPSWTTENQIFSGTAYDLNLGKGFRSHYFQYRLNLDTNSAWPRVDFDNNIAHVRDTNVYYYTLSTPTIVTIFHPSDSNWLAGTQTFDFNILSSTNATDLNFDLNIAQSGSQGTGTALIDDGNVATTPNLFCDSNILSSVTTCHFVFDTNSVADGNYFLLASATGLLDSSFDASDRNFGIDNSVPTFIVTYPPESQYYQSDLFVFSVNERSLKDLNVYVGGVLSSFFNKDTNCSGTPVVSCFYNESSLVLGNSYLITFRASDQTGHSNEKQVGFLYKFGQIPPGVSAQEGNNMVTQPPTTITTIPVFLSNLDAFFAQFPWLKPLYDILVYPMFRFNVQENPFTIPLWQILLAILILFVIAVMYKKRKKKYFNS